MKYKVFVDGQAGTTGLKINERLAKRDDIEILRIPEEKRKDPEEKKKYLNNADIVFLCLPDEAAKESVAMITSSHTRVIDASTAHRTSDDWAYGIPELSPEHREKVRSAKRVAVPGCYASGFNTILYPLVKAGIVPADYPVSCNAVSGYSGGGKGLIEEYEAPENAERVSAPGLYALGLQHKHLPEMQKVCGLEMPPLFSPMVGKYYEGMLVSIPLYSKLLKDNMTGREVQAFLEKHYEGSNFVKVMPFEDESVLDKGFLRGLGCNHTNVIELYVFANEEGQVLLVSRLDNLGKGASGAAVQCMNVMLGIDETTSLV